MNEATSPIQITPPEYDRGQHIASSVRKRVAVPRRQFLEWNHRTPLEKVLPGTRLLPAVDRTEPLEGQFPNPGSIRRVILTDGNHAFEIIHENSEDKFAYQVWGFTSAPIIKYARCAFRYSDDGDGCIVDWVYEFRPTLLLLTPIVFLFAKIVFRGYMKKSIETIRTLAEASYLENES